MVGWDPASAVGIWEPRVVWKRRPCKRETVEEEEVARWEETIPSLRPETLITKLDPRKSKRMYYLM